jgi:hypothetical protein
LVFFEAQTLATRIPPRGRFFSALHGDRLSGACGNIAGLLSNSKFTLDPSLIIRGAAKDLSQYATNEMIEGKKPDLDTFVKQMGDDYRMASKVTSGSLLVLIEQGNKPTR